MHFKAIITIMSILPITITLASPGSYPLEARQQNQYIVVCGDGAHKARY
jgi:hypothetical protein